MMTLEPKEKAPVKQPALNTPERIRTSDLWFRSPRFDWTLLSIQPVDCRPLLPISVCSGRFAPGFDPDAVVRQSRYFLEPRYFCIRIICLVATVWLAASQYEFGRRHWFALPIGKILRKKNSSFASPAQNAEIPSLIQ